MDLMLNSSNKTVQYSTVQIRISYTYVEHVEQLTLPLTVRTVAAGHRMIMEGWEMFKEVVEAAGTGDLPQLL